MCFTCQVKSATTSIVHYGEWNSGADNIASRARFYVHPNDITSSDIGLKLIVINSEANLTMEYKGIKVSIILYCVKTIIITAVLK